jgi:hypothetical protein
MIVAMRLIPALLTIPCLSVGVPLAAQPTAQMREVNVTTDSAPGWLPSEAEERAARGALDRYFATVEAGDDRGAYAMMTPGFQALAPYAGFAADNARFRDLAGTLRDRRVVRLTWTKDPADAPRPGIYAAFDVAARYTRVDRQCGYVILYHEADGAPFQIVRVENNFLSNDNAQDIEQTQGRGALDQAWAAASSNCPNYQP